MNRNVERMPGDAEAAGAIIAMGDHTTPSASAVASVTATGGMSLADRVAMGNGLAKTGMLPEWIRNGWQFAAITLTGDEMGMQPMRSVRSLQMVKGKVIESADSQLARFKAGGGRAMFRTLDETVAVLWLRHPNGDEHVETFSIDDAKRAGVTSNPSWSKWPKAMLRSRAITAGLKSLGWEGAVGAYDPDEIETAQAPASVPHVPAFEREHPEPETRSVAADVLAKGVRLIELAATDTELVSLRSRFAAYAGFSDDDRAELDRRLVARLDAIEDAAGGAAT